MFRLARRSRNQLSVGNLFDAQGQVANIIGVLYEVKPMAPRDFRKQLHRLALSPVGVRTCEVHSVVSRLP